MLWAHEEIRYFMRNVVETSVTMVITKIRAMTVSHGFSAVFYDTVYSIY